MSKVTIIPHPISQFETTEEFKLDKNVAIVYDESLKNSAQFLKTFIKNGSHIELKDSNGKDKLILELIILF